MSPRLVPRSPRSPPNDHCHCSTSRRTMRTGGSVRRPPRSRRLADTARSDGLSRAGGRDRQHDRPRDGSRSGRDPLPAAGRFGTAAGRGAWFQVEATRHHRNEFLVFIGDSARARKGSSWDHVHRLITGADPAITARILTGLSSGEGLIHAVRDPAGQDPGSTDRRLLVIEPEFVSVLKNISREISTLSPTFRSAWDGRPLAILTRTAPARATDAHIWVIGHITATELQHHINPVELANGLLNRFLLLGCRRVRLLPEGGAPDPLERTGLDRRLQATLNTARHAGRCASHPPPTTPGQTPTNSSPNPSPGSPARSRARRSAHHPPRADLRPARHRPADPAIAPDRRARALELRATLRQLGA